MNLGIEIPCAGSGQDAEFKTDHRIPAERFQVMTDVVLDSLTGLTWCRNVNPAEFPLDWNAAHDFINEMNGVRASGRNGYGGHGGSYGYPCIRVQGEKKYPKKSLTLKQLKPFQASDKS